jgi:hypothetical protein
MAEVGRPSKYKEEYCYQAEKLCRLGAKDTELAEFFGISVSTLNLWKLKHEDFSESLKKGKIISDVSVSESLFTKANGFKYMEEIGFKCKSYDEQGRQVEHVETKMVAKYMPPDTTACIFWLKNRRPDLWRDKPKEDEDDNRQELYKAIADKLLDGNK